MNQTTFEPPKTREEYFQRLHSLGKLLRQETNKEEIEKLKTQIEELSIFYHNSSYIEEDIKELKKIENQTEQSLTQEQKQPVFFNHAFVAKYDPSLLKNKKDK